MAHKALIGGTAYHISGGRVSIGGTSYSVAKGKTNIAGTAYAIGFRKPTLRELPVGTSVYLKVNNIRTEFIVAQHGLPSSAYDNSCNGTWLVMRNCYEERAWASSNYNGYASSDIHNYLNNSFINLFDSDIRSTIKQVKIPYSTDGRPTGAVCSGQSGLVTKIFLLSYSEALGGSHDRAREEGAILSYFAGGAHTRIAYFNGKKTSWWFRSPFVSLTDTAYISLMCYSDGSKHATGSVTRAYGIRPAFILPDYLLMDVNHNIVIE